MTTDISKPFPIESRVHPIVVAGHETLTARHKAKVAAAKAEYEARLEQRWLQAEAKRKAEWIAKERYDNPPRRIDNPHGDLTDAGVVRVATPSADRIRVLGECFTATQNVEFLVESLKVWLYRRKSKAPLSAVKDFLKEWVDVDGDDELFTETTGEHYHLNGPVGHGRRVPHIERRVMASGLSPALARILRSFTIQRGTVWFAGDIEIIDQPGIRGENITGASDMPDEFPAEEF